MVDLDNAISLDSWCLSCSMSQLLFILFQWQPPVVHKSPAMMPLWGSTPLRACLNSFSILVTGKIDSTLQAISSCPTFRCNHCIAALLTYLVLGLLTCTGVRTGWWFCFHAFSLSVISVSDLEAAMASDNAFCICRLKELVL